ncbi:hypothetical protein ACFL2H_11920 [Planctomycetota bacterium]
MNEIHRTAILILTVATATICRGESVPLFIPDLDNLQADPTVDGPDQGGAIHLPEDLFPSAMVFGVVSPITVTHFGWNDRERDGLLGDVRVTLLSYNYLKDDITEIVSAILPAGDDAELTDAGWRKFRVPEITLEPSVDSYYAVTFDISTDVIGNAAVAREAHDLRIGDVLQCFLPLTAFPQCLLANTVALGPTLFVENDRGDFDRNGQLDVTDIDLLTADIYKRINVPRFDLNSDQVLDLNDREIWVHDLRGTYFGDATLDGEFSSRDLVRVFTLNEYEDTIRRNSTWETGDWNGDRDFTSSDLILAFQDGGYEQGPRPSLVPEPALSWIAVLACFLMQPRRM